ncbi:MAG: DUF1826 domain-containing protein [Pseudomonadota bacterium]
MGFQRLASESAAIGVNVVDLPEALSSFFEAGEAAAIWHRQPAPGFQDWIDRLPTEQLPRGREILQPRQVHDTVIALCDAAGMPAGPERDWLIEDITALAQFFADAMSTAHLRLRLDVITGNACRRFHIDAVTARFLCTYRGTGTQYGVSTDGEQPREVFTVPTGAPILLRGTQWPDPNASGLLHRSPPIEGTGETRLVLVLDAISDPEDAV